jgi:hypothetical protein
MIDRAVWLGPRPDIPGRWPAANCNSACSVSANRVNGRARVVLDAIAGFAQDPRSELIVGVVKA